MAYPSGRTLLRWLGQIIGNTCLFLLGWELPHRAYLAEARLVRRLVIVFPHSTYFDFFFFVLYALADPQLFEVATIAMKPVFFHRWGWLLRPLGCIPATAREDHGRGFVDQVTADLNKRSRFAFLIAPKGTTHWAPWRSGWYWIARRSQASIRMVAFDYAAKRIVFGKVYHPTTGDQERLEDFLKHDFKEIAPLYWRNEIGRYDPRASVANYEGLTILLTGLIRAILWPTVWTLAWLRWLDLITGFLYHRSGSYDPALKRFTYVSDWLHVEVALIVLYHWFNGMGWVVAFAYYAYLVCYRSLQTDTFNLVLGCSRVFGV